MKQKLQISKGFIFIIIGILFLFVTFYNVNDTIVRTFENSNLEADYSFYRALEILRFDFVLSEFIVPTAFNFVFSALFMGVGLIEIIESGIFKKEGDDNAY